MQKINNKACYTVKPDSFAITKKLSKNINLLPYINSLCLAVTLIKEGQVNWFSQVDKMSITKSLGLQLF